MHDHLFIRMLTGGDLMVEAPVAPEWKGRNARALFVLLAMQPGERISRDRLAGLLWPESDQQAARANLRMTLLGLRRTLEPLDAGLLGVTNEAVTLNVGRDAVDVALFETLSERPDAESRIAALSIYRGDLVAGLTPPSEAFDGFVRAERARLRESAIATGLALIAALEMEGAYDRMSTVIRRLLAIDPANEPAHRAMMHAHMQAGDRAAALRQFDQCRAALRDQYDLEPSEESVELRNQIAGASRGTAPTVDGHSPRDAAGDRNSGSETTPFEITPAIPRMSVKRRLVALAVVVAIGVLVSLIWPGGGPPEDGSGPKAVRVSIAPIEAELSGCQYQHLKRDVRLLLEEELISMPQVAVILTGRTGDADDLSGLYGLEVHVQCRNTDFRVSLTVQRSGSDIADWVGQYDKDGHTLEEVMQRVMEDLRPLLERAGRNQLPAGQP